MTKTNFTDLEWHDAIIENIIIDRTNPGNKDTIEIYIVWPSEKKSKIIFKDVYYANLSLNFGVVADETVMDAFIIDNSDIDILKIKNKWDKYFTEIDDINGFEILTASTSSSIKIFAMSFDIINI